MVAADLTRRAILTAVAAMPFVRCANAQTKDAQILWPERPVRVMVPYPPAGGADTTARIIYARLSQDFGQQFAIENRGGAGGTIGEQAVASAAPDGYTILHDATAFSVNASLYQDLPFDYRNDFDPVFLVAQVANILVVTPSVPVTTVADVIAFAKASPGGIDMASSGNGTLQHLLLELFARAAGIKINHIPYRGGGLAMTDVMAGQVKFYFANGSAAVGLIQSGKLKAIAHTGKGRLASLPDIPPLSDTLPGFEGYDWNGVFVPHGTPAAIALKLNAGLNAALISPQVAARFAELNIQSRPNTPEEFRAYVESQMQLWNRVVKEANIKLG
jgi:tripartite-type tricarboxylate transporter receptor subunit TctC